MQPLRSLWRFVRCPMPRHAPATGPGTPSDSKTRIAFCCRPPLCHAEGTSLFWGQLEWGEAVISGGHCVGSRDGGREGGRSKKPSRGMTGGSQETAEGALRSEKSRFGALGPVARERGPTLQSAGAELRWPGDGTAPDGAPGPSGGRMYTNMRATKAVI